MGIALGRPDLRVTQQLGNDGQPEAPTDHESSEYARELRRWREQRGLSKKGLAQLMAYELPFVLAADSSAVRRHAADLGLLDPSGPARGLVE